MTDIPATILSDLREGYGVEDIAVRHGFDLHQVRAEVEILRLDGTLDCIYRDEGLFEPIEKPEGFAKRTRAKRVVVLWDGLRTSQTMHPDFLVAVSDTGERPE